MAKFNPKDLSYDQSLPPFLAALRGQLQGDDRGPDPILAGRRRAAKKRSASEEAEDAPLVVDEHGHAVDVATAEEKSSEARVEAESEEVPKTTDDTNNVAFGAGKKRRVGKVVGGDEYAAAERDLKRKRGAKDGAKKDDKSDNHNKKETKGDTKKPKKEKKEKKKIQLSFENDED